MLKVTPLQAKAIMATLNAMFENGDIDEVWNIDQKTTSRILYEGLQNGARSFGIITEDLKTVVQDILAAGDRLETITPRIRQNLVIAANQAGIAVCA